MPGLGRRTFAAGEVLTASNVMGYLQDQAVMNFAGTAARGSAVGTAVSQGMVSYLADSNAIQAYDGSAWKTISTLSGSVLQVVHATYAVAVINSTSTPIASGLTATITPKFSTSKILVLITQGGVQKSSGNAGSWLALFLRRNGTQLERQLGGYTGFSSDNYIGNMTFNYLDDAATTSPITYDTTFANVVNAASVQLQGSSTPSHITLIEIAA